MLGDQTKTGDKTNEFEIIQPDWLKTARNFLVLNASKSQHLHVRPHPSHTLRVPHQDGTHAPLAYGMSTQFPVVIIVNTLNPRAQADATAVQARSMPAFVRRTFE